jgi:ubiquinone/menaquinone biosynthesis C-methylase UbiE
MLLCLGHFPGIFIPSQRNAKSSIDKDMLMDILHLHNFGALNSMRRLIHISKHFIHTTSSPFATTPKTIQYQHTMPATNKLFDNQISAVKAWKGRATDYENITGGCTRRIAEVGLSKLPKLTSSTKILDSAAGPGIVTSLILDKAREQGLDPLPSILATDFSDGMIEQLNENKAAGGWDTVEAKVLDSQNLEGVDDNSFDVVFMNFALFALPDAAKGASEMLRVLKPGGVAIVTTWRQAGSVELLEKAVMAIRPQDKNRVFPISRDWLKQEKLHDTMVKGGFKPDKVEISRVPGLWKNETVDDIVEAFGGCFWDPIRHDWSEEDKGRWNGEILNALTDEQKASVSLEMHAWMCYAVKD